TVSSCQNVTLVKAYCSRCLTEISCRIVTISITAFFSCVDVYSHPAIAIAAVRRSYETTLGILVCVYLKLYQVPCVSLYCYSSRYRKIRYVVCINRVWKWVCLCKTILSVLGKAWAYCIALNRLR